MALTNAERQKKYKETHRALDLALVQVWIPKDRIVELKLIALRMTEEGSKDKEPSQRHLSFAQFLRDKKGLKLLSVVLLSSKKLFDWLNKNKRNTDKTTENERLPCH